eukprot:scaffold6568_cov126-Isochrysis_galbana.AAC.9
MMFTPAEPRAGPMGGAGVALPASIASLMILEIFFFLAIMVGSVTRTAGDAAAACRTDEPIAGDTKRPVAWVQQHTSKATIDDTGDRLDSMADDDWAGRRCDLRSGVDHGCTTSKRKFGARAVAASEPCRTTRRRR